MISVKKIFRATVMFFLLSYYVGEYGLEGLRPKNFNLSVD